MSHSVISPPTPHKEVKVITIVTLQVVLESLNLSVGFIWNSYWTHACLMVKKMWPLVSERDPRDPDGTSIGSVKRCCPNGTMLTKLTWRSAIWPCRGLARCVPIHLPPTYWIRWLWVRDCTLIGYWLLLIGCWALTNQCTRWKSEVKKANDGHTP